MAPPTLDEHTFKDAVKTFVMLHDDLMERQKQFRDLRRKKDELGNAILSFMKNNGIDEFQVGDGKLMRKASKRTEGVRREHIFNTLKATLNDEARAEACVTQIYQHRESKETEILRRTRQGKTTADRSDDPGDDLEV